MRLTGMGKVAGSWLFVPATERFVYGNLLKERDGIL